MKHLITMIMAHKSQQCHHYYRRHRYSILIICLMLICMCNSFNFDGSSQSYGKYEAWEPCNNGSLSFEFKTKSSSALLMYTGGHGVIKDYFMIQLINGVMHLSYSLNNEFNMLTVNTGQGLTNNEWHSVDLVRDGRLTTLKVDQIDNTRKSDNYDLDYEIFGNSRDNYVFIGGLPLEYNQKLSELALPKVVFEPRLQGSVRNIFYSNCGKPLVKAELLDSDGIVLDDNECMKNDPCKNKGICVTKNHGVMCDCTYTDYSGEYCEIERKPLEAMFQGSQFMTYDLTKRGEPIYSSNDQLSMYFKTTQSSGLLFFTGDKQDYLTVSFKNGSVHVAVDLGSGAYNHMVNAGGFKLDDGQWHHLMVTRNSRKIIIEVDGHVRDKGSTTGDFSLLSSNILYLGGSPRPHELLGSKVRTNFRGCMKKVEYTADTVVLDLIELAHQDHHLISVMGDIVYGKCVEVIDAQPVTFLTPEAFIGLPRWDVNRDHGTIAFQFSTTESNGLIMYNSGTFGSSNHDFFALEIMDGHFYLVMDIGTGAIKEKVSRSRVDDGSPHSVYFNYRGDKGFIRLDSHETDYKTVGSGKQLNLEDMLFVGGIDFERYKYRLPKELWSGTLGHGFVGCIQELEINDEKVDLMTVARTQKQKSIQAECKRMEPQCLSHPCLHGGSCSEGWNRYICHCENTAYRGQNCHDAIATVTFNEAQYVMVTLPQESFTEAEDISLRFRTLKAGGLLLMTASSTSEDAIELYLERGACKLMVSLGTGSKTLSVGHALNDNQWHTVFVKRRGQNLKLGIDDSQPVTDIIPRIDTAVGVKQIVLGSMGPLLSELSGSSQTSLTIDDTPDGYQSDSPIRQHPWFDGAMQQFIFNGNHFFDMAQEENPENIEFTARFDDSDTEVHDPITFESQESYVTLPHQLLKSNSLHFSINFKFRTQQESGLIIFSGLQSDFLALELTHGYLNYIYDMGGGTKRILVNTPKSLTDNKWHDVSLFRPQLDQQQIRVDNYPPTVEDMKGYKARHFDLKGPLYLGGLVKTRYYSLSEKVKSKKGFMGCLANFDINGEELDILEVGSMGETSATNSVTRGCSSSEMGCHEHSCHNGGRCEPIWNSYQCNCDMTSFTGVQCSDESVSYQFGLGSGLIVFEYPEDDRRSTKTDYLAFGITTIQKEAKVLRIDSATNDDFIEVELVSGNIFMVYNMGSESIPIVTLEQRVNDGKYHVIRFVREGFDAFLEVDKDSQRKEPEGQKMSLFNDQARIMIGGRRSSLGGISSGFHGTISGFVFNGMRILDLLTEGDPRVRMEGDVTLLEQPLPKSPPAHEGGNVVYNNGMQSTQGVKRKLYKRSLVSENSSRSKPKSSNKRSSTFYLQYKNKIKDLEAFEEFLTIMENDIAKKKSSAVGLPPPVVQNHAQKTFHKRKHSKTSLGPSYDILSKSDSRDEKDHVLDGNIESIYSSGDHGMVANDDTNLESSGFSILTLESFPTDDESLLVNKTKDWKGRMNKFIKSFTMFLPSTNKQQTGDHLSSVKVGTSRNQPFARANSRVGRIYPIDRGKHHSNSKRRKTLLKKKKLTNRIHSKSTTPRQVTDDIISSSGDGPDCYSDDEDECIVTPSEDDIITPAIVITKADPPRRPKNVTCVDDCPTPIGTELFPMLEKNKTLVLPPRGTTSPNGMTTERSEPSAKKSPGDSGHLNIFLIIGIVAGVLVALIILLIAFYKFRRSDEGSYRVDESQNFAYLEAKKQQSNGTSGGSVGNGKAGGKKKDVKEWYV